MDTVLLPSNYHKILRDNGTVHVYGQDWRTSDYHSATAQHTKVQRSCRISDARIIEINRDAVCLKDPYHDATVSHLKLRRSLESMGMENDPT